MKTIFQRAILVASAMLIATFSTVPRVASASTTSTALIIAAAAAIAGALLYDSSGRPYYVRSNKRYYVSQPVAQYYQGHHKGVYRKAWVPEQEYPVAQPPPRAPQPPRGPQHH
jgi:hypothetical protein